MRSPTQRSLAYWRKKGIACAIIEKWQHIPGAEFPKRLDTWGCDIIGVTMEGEPRIYLGQTTGDSGGNHAARRKKMLDIPELRRCVEAGCLVELHSWGTRKKDGKDAWRGRIERMQVGLDGAVFVPADEVWSVKRAKRNGNAKLRDRAEYMRRIYGG